MLALLLAAAASIPSCPPSIDVASSTQAPAPWRATRLLESPSHSLDDVSFSDGDPDSRVFLPPQTQRRGGRLIDRYSFTGRNRGPVWMICQYKDTDAVLVQETSLQGQMCQVSHGRTAAGAPFAMSCASPR